jgi:predicted transcriptional regulator
MQTVSVQVPEEWVETIDERADEHDTTRAAILRTVIDNGLRAHKYDKADFAVYLERMERADAVELARRDDMRP